MTGHKNAHYQGWTEVLLEFPLVTLKTHPLIMGILSSTICDHTDIIRIRVRSLNWRRIPRDVLILYSFYSFNSNNKCPHTEEAYRHLFSLSAYLSVEIRHIYSSVVAYLEYCSSRLLANFPLTQLKILFVFLMVCFL